MKSSVVKFSRYYSPTIKREARRRQREEREHKPGLSINITRSSGYRAREIAPSRTIGRFLWGDVLFFPLRFLSASARRPRGRRNVGEGSEYLSTIIIAACVMYHVVLQADSSVYIRIHGGLAELPSEREREKREKDDGPSDTRARPCISRRFGRAGHYRRRNKSKPRERESLAICYSPPREKAS